MKNFEYDKISQGLLRLNKNASGRDCDIRHNVSMTKMTSLITMLTFSLVFEAPLALDQ